MIAVVKPGSMEKRLFHDKKKYEGYVPDPDGQVPETEDYGRIWKLLEPLASDPRTGSPTHVDVPGVVFSYFESCLSLLRAVSLVMP